MVVSRVLAFAASLLTGAEGARSLQMSAVFDRVAVDRATQRITIAHDPASGSAPTASVVVMHGLGDSSQGWLDVAAMWAKAFPSARFVLPTAPVRPITLNGGMRMTGWYDIASLDSDRAEQTCDGIDESRAIIDAIIDEEARAVGGSSRVVLAGFSQGGALALYTGLQRASEPIAGVLCMSGYLPKAEAWAPAGPMRAAPVLLCHGDSDPLVRPDWAAKSAAALKEAHGMASVELKMYKGMEHSACEEEIRDAAAFLARVLGLSPS